MTPRFSLALDTVCWVGLTLVFLYFKLYWLAGVLGLFAICYLAWCIRAMLFIMNVEQQMGDYLDEDYEDTDE